MSALYATDRVHLGLDHLIAELATKQHGVFTRVQAIGCGATKDAIAWRLRTGRWVSVHTSVYKLAGTKQTWRQRAMAACLYLGSGAVLSFRAAAALGKLLGSEGVKIEVTVPRGRDRSAVGKIKVHSTVQPIPAEDITTIDGIPVTKPARTLLDLAAVEPEHVVERALEEALRRRLVSLAFLDAWLDDPRRRRQRGTRMLHRLVRMRATVGVTESPLETQVLRLLRAAGLPIPMLQYEVRDGERFVARIDFAYPRYRVAIEADGFRFHDNRRHFDAERRRLNRLAVLGWLVVQVTAKHVDETPELVADWVRGALAARGAL